MQQDTLINLCKMRELTATIINTADSPHYLIGAEDPDGNYFPVESELNRPLHLGSLELAKQWFKDVGIHYAIFEMQTAYDEMVGIEGPTKVRQILSFPSA